MSKRRIKETIASTARRIGMLSIRSIRNKSKSPPSNCAILMYHRVLENISEPDNLVQPGMAVSAETFEEQLQYLSTHYPVIPLSDMVARLKSGRVGKEKFAAITFDDGWKDNVTVAYPILKKMSIPATIYLTTDFVETGKSFWFLRLTRIITRYSPETSILARMLDSTAAEQNIPLDVTPTDITDSSGRLDIQKFMVQVKRLNPDSIERLIADLERELKADSGDELAQMIMTWDDVRSMDSAIIQIGSHGCSHKILTQLNDETVKDELERSKREIEGRLDREIDAFAYPNGDHDKRIRSLTADAGYKHAVATRDAQPPAGLDLFRLQRISIHEGVTQSARGGFSEDLFAAALSRLFG